MYRKNAFSTLAWPWYVPMGLVITVGIGWLSTSLLDGGTEAPGDRT